MKRTDFIAQRVERLLHPLERFHSVEALDYFSKLPTSGEFVFGVYENFPSRPSKSILITSHRLYMEQGGCWIVLPYESIQEAFVLHGVDQSLMQYQRGSQKITLDLYTGQAVELLVLGGKHPRRDIWDFCRFLQLVSALQ